MYVVVIVIHLGCHLSTFYMTCHHMYGLRHRRRADARARGREDRHSAPRKSVRRRYRTCSTRSHFIFRFFHYYLDIFKVFRTDSGATDARFSSAKAMKLCLSNKKKKLKFDKAQIRQIQKHHWKFLVKHIYQCLATFYIATFGNIIFKNEQNAQTKWEPHRQMRHIWSSDTKALNHLSVSQ